MKLADCLNIDDVREAARHRAHKMVFDYIDGAADDEWTLARNRNAFDDYRLLHRVLAGVETIDTSTNLLGYDLDVPFILSPSAGNRLFHKDGERAVARAAEAFGTIYSLSTLSTVSMDEISALTSTPKWFQLYVWKDRAIVSDMVKRAKEAGYTALILTVDMPIAGNRERDPRNRFTVPPSYGLQQAIEALKRPAWTLDYLTSETIRYANLSMKTPATSLAQFVDDQLHAGFNWEDAEWLLSEWQGTSILKGVMHPEDARRAIRTGFDGIMISNHGGRQLDGEAAPLDVLPAMREMVGPDVPLILDGGVRRGTHMLKALALGANAVSFARPYLYGLAAGGYDGVHKALSILSGELRRSMALLGATRIDEISQSHIFKA